MPDRTVGEFGNVSKAAELTSVASVCPECGHHQLESFNDGCETGCASCFERYLRSIDADFLDNYARFGARGRQVVAEACLRALVLSDMSDRKLLAMTVYEQFVAAAADFIGLYRALLNRRTEPIVKGMLGFELATRDTLRFFSDLAGSGPTAMLNAVGLPHGDQVPSLAVSSLDKRERQQVRAALLEALSDLCRLTEFRDVGERALVNAARRLGATTLTDQTGWIAGSRLPAGQVAALALNRERRAVEINLLSTDEDTLAAVVDGIDVLTRLTRNIIFAFVSLHSPAQFREGFPGDV
jgi:hypothetical protein